MRRALAGWFATRATVVGAVLAVAALAGLGPETHPLALGPWWLDRFVHWDSYHLLRIADEGYFAADRMCCDQAYLPGQPLLMEAFGVLLGGHTALAGVLLSLVTGTIAAVALHALARDRGLSRPGARMAVAAFAVAPFTVFTVALYTESLWLAGALLAWWAAGRRLWWVAGLAASVATATRITGLFLLAGLAILYAVQLRSAPGRDGVRRWSRPRSDALALALPLVPVLAFMVWLHGRTGSWTAWRDAQTIGWHRRTVWPWEGLADQWTDVVSAPDGWLLLARSLDLGAVLAGVALTLVLVRRREWPEVAYVGLSVLAISTTTVWESSGRYALAWFPAYVLLADVWERGGSRPRRMTGAVLTGSAVLACAVTVAFATRHWIG